MHYQSKRDDTEFWKDFKTKYPMLENANKTIDILNNLNTWESEDFMFTKQSWLQVASPLGLLNRKDNTTPISSEYDLDKSLENLLQNNINIVRSCITHKELLDYTRGLYDRQFTN